EAGGDQRPGQLDGRLARRQVADDPQLDDDADKCKAGAERPDTERRRPDEAMDPLSAVRGVESEFGFVGSDHGLAARLRHAASRNGPRTPCCTRTPWRTGWVGSPGLWRTIGVKS